MPDAALISLEEFTTPAVESLPAEVDVEHVFTRENLPAPPDELVTDQVTILKAVKAWARVTS